jgi:hypothetical protein
MKMDQEDRIKTGCLGILIPLFFGAYAVRWIIERRAGRIRFRDIGKQPLTGEAAVALGITALGICLFVHALGFVPYERFPLLKWLLAAAGVVVFFIGLSWERL